MADGQMTDDEERAKRLEAEVGGAREYFPTDPATGLAPQTYFDGGDEKPLTQAQVQGAVDLVDGIDGRREANPQPQQAQPQTLQAQKQDAADLPEGTFGVRKNEDFTQYRAERDAAHRAVAAAKAARDDAAKKMRDSMLASGLFYDNGRGQVRRKKGRRGLVYGADPFSGDPNALIAAAGADAWDAALAEQRSQSAGRARAHTQSAIEMNRQAAARRTEERATRERNRANGRLAVFDAFAAAIDAMNADATGAADNVTKVWGGKDENGRDARWRYDANGRILGQADARDVVDGKRLADGSVQKTGDGFRRGFVSQDVLGSINDSLKDRGLNYRITGVMAKQAVDAFGKPAEGRDPMLLVTGVRNDGTKFARRMTQKEAYRWGLENYRAANAGAKEGDAERFASGGLGGYDPYGYLAHLDRPNWHESVAQIGADAKKDVAQIKAGSNEKIAAEGNASKEKIAAEGNANRLEIEKMRDFRARTSKAMVGLPPATAQSLNRDLDAAEKIIKTAKTTEDVDKAYATISKIADKLHVAYDRPESAPSAAPATESAAGQEAQVPEFNPKGKYRAGDRFSRNGIIYEVGADGKPHKVQ